ncbi:MAG: thioesterase II family protein [Myxococcota bacterium]
MNGQFVEGPKHSLGTATIQLLAFPFAGGNSRCYQELQRALPTSVKLSTYELPGHGLRMRESLLRDMAAVVDDALRRVDSLLDEPYALYGHSFGAAVARELAQRVFELGRPMPRQIFVSGRRAPASVVVDTPLHQLSSASFHARLAKYGGTPPAVLQNAELMAMFERILRADLQALESAPQGRSRPLDVPIHVMVGLEDDVTEEQVQAWQLETLQPLSVSRFSGGHFFIREHAAEIAARIAEDLGMDQVTPSHRARNTALGF